MKKNLLLIGLIFAGLTVNAQSTTTENEEEAQQQAVTSIEDIINVQQELTENSTQEKHFQDVWSKKSYVNFNYNMSHLTPKEDYPTGVPGINNGRVPEFKSNWGIVLEVGRNYSLIKKPLVNMVQINLDYNPVELTVNHYKAEGNSNLYDSNQELDGKYYYPWNLQKYQFNYGMTLGPSVTVAPFTKLNIEQLDFLKLNVYYHIGYQVSLLYSPNKKGADINQDTNSNAYKKVEDSLKLQFGHGLISSFGFNISWKAIGLGYEYSYSPFSYFSLNKEDYGKTKYKFKNSSNRIYIQIRM